MGEKEGPRVIVIFLIAPTPAPELRGRRILISFTRGESKKNDFANKSFHYLGRRGGFMVITGFSSWSWWAITPDGKVRGLENDFPSPVVLCYMRMYFTNLIAARAEINFWSYVTRAVLA